MEAYGPRSLLSWRMKKNLYSSVAVEGVAERMVHRGSLEDGLLEAETQVDCVEPGQRCLVNLQGFLGVSV